MTDVDINAAVRAGTAPKDMGSPAMAKKDIDEALAPVEALVAEAHALWQPLYQDFKQTSAPRRIAYFDSVMKYLQRQEVPPPVDAEERTWHLLERFRNFKEVRSAYTNSLYWMERALRELRTPHDSAISTKPFSKGRMYMIIAQGGDKPASLSAFISAIDKLRQEMMADPAQKIQPHERDRADEIIASLAQLPPVLEKLQQAVQEFQSALGICSARVPKLLTR